MVLKRVKLGKVISMYGQEIHLTVVPKPLRTTLLRLSHDFNGHVGAKKVKAILNRPQQLAFYQSPE